MTELKKKEEDASVKRESRTVLIVDSSEETREVLATALQRRGVRTIATARPRRGLELVRQEQPDLIVFDLEAERVPAEKGFTSFTDKKDVADTPLVILGTVRGNFSNHEGAFISKPYHFAPLVQKIEEMLEEISQQKKNKK